MTEEKTRKAKGPKARALDPISLARQEGLVRVLQRSAAPEMYGAHNFRAAFFLGNLLSRAQRRGKQAKQARADWNKACGLGRGRWRNDRLAKMARNAIRDTVDAEDRAAALVAFLDRFAIDRERLNRVVQSRWPGPGALPQCTDTGPPTKQSCFVLLDFAVGLAPDLGYAKANIKHLGARVRRIYDGR